MFIIAGKHRRIKQAVLFLLFNFTVNMRRWFTPSLSFLTKRFAELFVTNSREMHLKAKSADLFHWVSDNFPSLQRPPPSFSASQTLKAKFFNSWQPQLSSSDKLQLRICLQKKSNLLLPDLHCRRVFKQGQCIYFCTYKLSLCNVCALFTFFFL